MYIYIYIIVVQYWMILRPPTGRGHATPVLRFDWPQQWLQWPVDQQLLPWTDMRWYNLLAMSASWCDSGREGLGTNSMTQVCSVEMALQIYVKPFKTAMRNEIALWIIPAFQPKQWGRSESIDLGICKHAVFFWIISGYPPIFRQAYFPSRV